MGLLEIHGPRWPADESPLQCVAMPGRRFLRPGDMDLAEHALAAYDEVPEYACVGFVFAADDPFCGIDLDNCLNANGEFRWGREIVDQFDCYSEVSPSGLGVKLFFRGRKPDFARCEAHGAGADSGSRIEIYDRSRFFAVTDRTLKNPPGEVAERQEQLNDLCRRLWPPQPPVKLIVATTRRPTAHAVPFRIWMQCRRPLAGKAGTMPPTPQRPRWSRDLALSPTGHCVCWPSITIRDAIHHGPSRSCA